MTAPLLEAQALFAALRAPRGDAAFAQLHAQLTPRLMALCYGITRNVADAQDAVQDTWVAIRRALPEFRGDAKLSTWAMQIAIRMAVRARQQSTRSTGAPSAVEPVSEAPSPEEVADARHRAAAVEGALARLSLEHRAVLTLFAIDGLSHGDIAEVLGIPEGTVWSRLHLARKRLHALLEQSES